MGFHDFFRRRLYLNGIALRKLVASFELINGYMPKRKENIATFHVYVNKNISNLEYCNILETIS